MVEIVPTLDIATLGALILAFLVVFLVIFVIVYIYSAIALMTLARKLKTKNPWLAWIPIANIYLITQMARVSGWWTLLILAVFIPVIGGLAVVVGMAWAFWIISERRGFPGWFGILMAITPINLVFLGILAWGKK